MNFNHKRAIGRFHLLTAKASLAFLSALLPIACTWPDWKKEYPPVAAPHTRVEAVRETIHGVELTDPYRWLEDQQSPETRAWIDAQNDYTRKMLASFKGREAIKKRLGELMKIDTMSAPIARGGRYFFSRKLADQDLWVIVMREGLDGKDQVLVDPHPMSPDHSTSVGIMDISDDGKLLAYFVREGGKDETAVRFLDVDSRRELTDALPPARYFGLSLAPDKSGFYYSRHGEEGSRIYYHKMGGEPASDRKIFGDGYGPEKLVYAFLSENGRHLVITVHHGSAAKKTEVYSKNAALDGPIIPIVNDLDARFEPQVGGDTLYIRTNLDAPNGRILAVDLNDPVPDNRLVRETWREVIPQGPDVIEELTPVAGKLFITYLHNVQSLVKIFAADGKYERDLELPAMGSAGGFSGKWDSPEIFYSFSTFHIPTTIYRLDMAAGAQSVWAKYAVPVDSSKFETKQVWVTSKDGTKFPMFVVHAKGLKLDGKNPAFLTGYGGFNISLTPGFSSRTALWIEHGGVYAVPNLRGGGEFGEAWHEAGMLSRKQNVFDDFIASAEWLVANKYTSPARLAINGGSNGGLLMGAMVTQRPGLFRAVVCGYPLLDMIRYHQFLVARFWVPEYGSSEDAGQFKTLLAYSPYHHVKPGTKFPAVLFVTGDSDTRVDPLHARKMTAIMQAANGGDHPILLHYDTKAGHSGGKPMGKLIEDQADEIGFIFWQLGM